MPSMRESSSQLSGSCLDDRRERPVVDHGVGRLAVGPLAPPRAEHVARAGPSRRRAAARRGTRHPQHRAGTAAARELARGHGRLDRGEDVGLQDVGRPAEQRMARMRLTRARAAAEDRVEAGAADRRRRERRALDRERAQRGRVGGARRVEVGGRLVHVAAADGRVRLGRISEVAQQRETAAAVLGRVARDRGERLPADAQRRAARGLDLGGSGCGRSHAGAGVLPPGRRVRATARVRRSARRRRAASCRARRDRRARRRRRHPRPRATRVAPSSSLTSARIDGALGDAPADQPAIGGGVQEHAARGLAVAPGTARLLVVGLERVGQRPVPDRAHVGLVDAHAEGGGRDHDLGLALHEPRLHRGALGVGQARVVGRRVQPLGPQLSGELLAAPARARVDERGTPCRPRPARAQEPPLRGLGARRDHVEREVRPVEAGRDLDRVAQAQRTAMSAATRRVAVAVSAIVQRAATSSRASASRR